MVNDTFRKMANPLEGTGALSESTLFSGLNQAMKSILETQQTARVGFIRLGQSIETSEQAAANYPNTIRRISAAYGMQGKELDGMMKSLQGVPMIMNQTTQMARNSVDAQQLMVDSTAELAMVSSTFGMSASEAATVATVSYRQFGQTVEETVDSMATMSSAAKESGVDRRIANEQIMEASRGLAIFGQKSDSAAGTWLTFMKALKDTTPIDQIGSITEQVTKSIASMSVQNRAFIGMMSGVAQGRSALGGAIQMEMMLRSPDGMQKHLESLTSTLAQFAGGQIITLEAASKNPQLEVGFQMQREMIGKLMGITDAQVQNRILETLKNVQSGGMSQADGTKELANLQKEGGSIQDKQLTALEKIDQHLAILLQDAFGIDTTLDRLNSFAQGDTGKENENFIKSLQTPFSAGKTARADEQRAGQKLRRTADYVGAHAAPTTTPIGATKSIYGTPELKGGYTRLATQAARPGALSSQINDIRWGTKEFNKELMTLSGVVKSIAQTMHDAQAAVGGRIGKVEERKLVGKPESVKLPTRVALEEKAIGVTIMNPEAFGKTMVNTPSEPAVTIAGNDVRQITNAGADKKEKETTWVDKFKESEIKTPVIGSTSIPEKIGPPMPMAEQASALPLLASAPKNIEERLGDYHLEPPSGRFGLADQNIPGDKNFGVAGTQQGSKNEFAINVNVSSNSDEAVKIVKEELKNFEEKINNRFSEHKKGTRTGSPL